MTSIRIAFAAALAAGALLVGGAYAAHSAASTDHVVALAAKTSTSGPILCCGDE